MPCQNPQPRQQQQHSEDRRRRRRRLPSSEENRGEEWASAEWGESEGRLRQRLLRDGWASKKQPPAGLGRCLKDWEKTGSRRKGQGKVPEQGSGRGRGVDSKLVTRWGCRCSSCWLRLFFARRFNEWGMRLHENCLRTIWAPVSCECYPHTHIHKDIYTHTHRHTHTRTHWHMQQVLATGLACCHIA